MTLDEAREHLNCQVEYRPPSLQATKFVEVGVIVQVDDHYAFVQFQNDRIPIPKPTAPELLSLR